jgi:hypothetical protein
VVPRLQRAESLAQRGSAPRAKIQRFKTDGIYGVKGGVFLNENAAQLEGSFGYMNHFELRQPPNAFNPGFGIANPPYVTVGGGG